MNHHSRTCQISGPDDRKRLAGEGRPLTLIAGPCVIEERDLTIGIARALRDACDAEGITLVFKASFDKANRTSGSSPRGPGMDEGLALLTEIRSTLNVPVTTDIHLPEQARPVAEVVDILQIPAFLCRQTDLLIAAGRAASRMGRAVNVKKGQFLSPEEMAGPVNKLIAAGCRDIIITERGTFFGYQRLVNDFIGLGDLMEMRFDHEVRPAVCFDATHSAQLPGAAGQVTGGRRERVPLLARAAIAAGADVLFLECHPSPAQARSDAATMLPLDQVAPLLRALNAIKGTSR